MDDSLSISPNPTSTPARGGTNSHANAARREPYSDRPSRRPFIITTGMVEQGKRARHQKSRAETPADSVENDPKLRIAGGLSLEYQVAIVRAGNAPPSLAIEPFGPRSWPRCQPYALTASVNKDFAGAFE
jgi:hypothetical protein